MLILGRERLNTFVVKYPPARSAFAKWMVVVEAAEWSNFADVKQTFSSADYVPPYVVFNIGGNKYRLAAKIEYDPKLFLIEKVMTHSEYDKWKP